MEDEISVTRAAELLATSGQTIRNYVRSGTLSARRGPNGRRLLVTRASVDTLLAERGPLNGGRRRKSSRVLAELDSEDALVRERDDLRARVIWLGDAVARLREAAPHQQQADAQRAAVVEGLLSAIHAAERADELRRRALAELEEAVAGSMLPGHLGELDDDV